MATASSRSALRALMRVCRRADQCPETAAAMVGTPPRLFDCVAGHAVSAPSEQSPFLADAVREICGSTQYAHPEGRARIAARTHYRRAAALGLPYREEATLLFGKLAAAEDVLAKASKRRTAVTATQFREGLLRPRGLRRLSPQDRSPPAVGDVLLAHPLSCLSQPVFDKSIVLVEHVGDEAVEGVVVNNFYSCTVGEVVQRLSYEAGAEDEEWMEPLRSGPLANFGVYLGGPVIEGTSRNNLRWLHRHGEGLAGCRKLAPGLWIGGNLQDLTDRVMSAGGNPNTHLRFIFGRAAWLPGQLMVELECGVWARGRPQCGSAPDNEATSLGNIWLTSDHCSGDAAWRQTLAFAGMPALASFPRGRLADQKLSQYLAAVQFWGEFEDESEPRPLYPLGRRKSKRRS